MIFVLILPRDSRGGGTVLAPNISFRVGVSRGNLPEVDQFARPSRIPWQVAHPADEDVQDAVREWDSSIIGLSLARPVRPLGDRRAPGSWRASVPQ